MKISKITLGLAAAALAAMPAVAQIAMTPAVAPLSGEESELDGGTAIILALGASVLIIGGIIVASDNDDADLPISG